MIRRILFNRFIEGYGEHMFIMVKGISLIIYNAITMDNGIVEWFIQVLSKELKKEEFREEILKPLVKSLISYIMPYVFFIIVINIFLIILTLSGVMYFINLKR